MREVQNFKSSVDVDLALSIKFRVLFCIVATMPLGTAGAAPVDAGASPPTLGLDARVLEAPVHFVRSRLYAYVFPRRSRLRPALVVVTEKDVHVPIVADELPKMKQCGCIGNKEEEATIRAREDVMIYLEAGDDPASTGQN